MIIIIAANIIADGALILKPDFSASARRKSYSLDSFFWVLNAVTFRMELITSSAIVPPREYAAKDFLLYLMMKVEPPAMANARPKIADVRMRLNSIKSFFSSD